MGQSSGEVIAITAVFTFLELFFVGLRLCARRITRGTGKGMGIDDVLASLAAVSDDIKNTNSAEISLTAHSFYMLSAWQYQLSFVRTSFPSPSIRMDMD